MSEERFTVSPLTAVAVRQIRSDLDDLKVASDESHDARPGLRAGNRADRDLTAHRAARLATPVGTVEDRQLELYRLERIGQQLWQVGFVGGRSTVSTTTLCELNLLLLDARTWLAGPYLDDSFVEPATRHPLAMTGWESFRPEQESAVLDMRAGGASYAAITRDLLLDDPVQVEEMARSGLSSAIDEHVEPYRTTAVERIDAEHQVFWAALMDPWSPDLSAIRRLTALITRRSELLGLLHIPPTPRIQKEPLMATEAQIAANRRNARKSTGPQTAQGKKRSSMNSTNHGCYSTRSYAIPSGPLAEDPEEIQHFIDAIIADLDPRTPLESTLAQQLAQSFLRTSRLGLLEADAIAKVASTRHSLDQLPSAPDVDPALNLRQLGAFDAITQVLAATRRIDRELTRKTELLLERYQKLRSDTEGPGSWNKTEQPESS